LGKRPLLVRIYDELEIFLTHFLFTFFSSRYVNSLKNESSFGILQHASIR